jgi:LuxR family maltose regulon positive regulatory protein
MAEETAGPRADVGSSERDVLLATKLHVPHPTGTSVLRPRLARQLAHGVDRGVVLVVAPAGYGKTVLLSEWTRDGQLPSGWLSLDAGDNDPARFWRHVIAALDRMYAGLGGRLDPLLGPPAPTSFSGLLTVLINELAGCPDGEALLVLDDYHVIDSETVHSSLGYLLEHRPPGLRLVLSSRSDPPLQLARFRARGELTEVRAADLRFTVGEADGLVRQVLAEPEPALPDAAVAELVRRTEGWAAGLQLAALSMRGRSDIPGFLAAFTGSHRYVLDYLAEEVLEQQTDQVRDFLLDTSVLDRLSGPLCDAVTGRPGSQLLLEQVERAGLFLIPLDETREWWRYHHLFADLLRARIEQQPGHAVSLHRNASHWYDEHELPDDAIRHAAAAGEPTQAARLAERHFDAAFYLRGETTTIQRWLGSVPAELITSRPRLLLMQAQLAAAGGRVEALQHAVDAAEAAAATAADEPFEPTIGPAASLIVNIRAHIALDRSYLAQLTGDAEATTEFARQALAELVDGEWMLRSIAQGLLGISEWLGGRLEAAEDAFRSSLSGWREVDQPTVVAWGSYQLGQVQRTRGRLDAAADTFRRTLDVTAPPGGPRPPAAGPSLLGLSDIAYQHNDLDLARGYATEGIGLCRRFVYSLPLAAGLVRLGWVRQATGDPAGAVAAFDEAAQVLPGPAGMLNRVSVHRARLALAHGDIAAAARWAVERALSATDQPRYQQEHEHLVLARVLIAQGHSDQALGLLDRLHLAAVAQQRTGSVIELSAIRALALVADGHDDAAMGALADALTLGAPQGYVRVFADEGPQLAALVGRLVASRRPVQSGADVPTGYLDRLQQSFRSDFGPTGSGSGARRAPAGMTGLVEPLTGRELEVLALLAAGRQNRAIADELVVTLDTVKKHVSHVLGKLGAANRTEAVDLARRLGLTS